jgi:hypothetical protein
MAETGTASFEPRSRSATFRRWVLRIHGIVLTVTALTLAVATTVGKSTGEGQFAFLHDQPLVWVGLIQAYLLMTIIAVLLFLGADQPYTRKWNLVGALAHAVPLFAALTALSVFQSMDEMQMAEIAIGFHVFWLAVETFTALLPVSKP